jgi:large-conductance mechanosensitive channel
MSAQNQVLTFAVAIYVGTTLAQFFNALIRDLVLPLLSPLATAEAGVGKLVITIYGIKLNVGDVIVQFANLLIVLAVVSYTLPYMKTYVPVAGAR